MMPAIWDVVFSVEPYLPFFPNFSPPPFLAVFECAMEAPMGGALLVHVKSNIAPPPILLVFECVIAAPVRGVCVLF